MDNISAMLTQALCVSLGLELQGVWSGVVEGWQSVGSLFVGNPTLAVAAVAGRKTFSTLINTAPPPIPKRFKLVRSVASPNPADPPFLSFFLSLLLPFVFPQLQPSSKKSPKP